MIRLHSAARYCGIVLSAALLGACSWIPGMDRLTGEDGLFRDRQGEYLEARTIPRTRIPDRYDSYIIDDLYVIPEIGGNAPTTSFLDAPRPRPIQGRSDREVVIQRINERSWVVVDASPSQVWPRIRDYWTSRGIALASENPTRGIMETAWFTEEGNALTKEKFRVIVEPGFQDESSEVKLLHMSMPQAVPALERVNWPETSENPQLEFDTLNELSTYLADAAGLYQASTVSFLAGNIPSDGKASLVSGPDAHLRLAADYERSWAAVGRALQRAGVEVNAQDQEQGTYEVGYTIIPEVEEKGFFGRLFTLERFSRSEPQEHVMRVQLRNNGGVVEVRVEDLDQQEPAPDGDAEPVDPEASLLQTIMNYIA